MRQYKILNIPFRIVKENDKVCCFLWKIKIYEKKFNEKNAENSNQLLKIKQLSANNIRIAIQLKGAIGDQLIGCNYIKALYDKISDKNVSIDIFCRPFISDLFLNNVDFINSVFPEPSFNEKDENYDLYVRLDRFPNVLKYNEHKIQKSPLLYKYVLLCQNFKQQNKMYYTGRSEYDSILNIYTLIKGQKRINQMDINSFLNMDEQFKYNIHLPESTIISDYNLQNKKIITIHRGFDANRNSNSNKLWPQEYYNLLISLIKEHFSDYTLVQLGINEQRCPAMKNIDLNLVGKTSLADVTNILKHSVLHIDGEGGMVHIRHAILGGVSVVIFGPTSKDFYGYSENINISSNACPHWCEHIKEKWDEGCLITNGEPLCMRSIYPKEVFNKIESYLNERG